MMNKNEDTPKTQKMKLLLDMELRKLDFQLNNIFTAAEIEAVKLQIIGVKLIYDLSSKR